MSEHSKEPQDQWVDCAMRHYDATSLLVLYVDAEGRTRFDVSWEESQPDSIESLADIFVGMIAGGMGEEILSQIKDKCVLDGREHLYDKLMVYFGGLSDELVQQHTEELNEEGLGDNDVVVPPDQTFIL
jgi:hypothetical protein